jgi:hypothetical protein
VPDSIDQKLEQLLGYNEALPSEEFVLDVMRGVRRKQLTRTVILWVFGLIGALFGLSGAIILSGPVGRLLPLDLGIPTMELMQGTLLIAGAAAFYLCFMNYVFHLGS